MLTHVPSRYFVPLIKEPANPMGAMLAEALEGMALPPISVFDIGNGGKESIDR